MSKVLRWILYVLLGLVVLAIVAGIVFAFVGGHGYTMMRPGFRMMEPYRFSYSPLRAIFGGLFGLGVFILVIVGIVALVSALLHGSRTTVVQTPAQVAAPTKPCANCGKPVQEDWKTCPYCGNPLT